MVWHWFASPLAFCSTAYAEQNFAAHSCRVQQASLESPNPPFCTRKISTSGTGPHLASIHSNERRRLASSSKARQSNGPSLRQPNAGAAAALDSALSRQEPFANSAATAAVAEAAAHAAATGTTESDRRTSEAAVSLQLLALARPVWHQFACLFR